MTASDPEAASLVSPAAYFIGQADQVRLLSLVGKLGRIMQHQNRAVGGSYGLAVLFGEALNDVVRLSGHRRPLP